MTAIMPKRKERVLVSMREYASSPPVTPRNTISAAPRRVAVVLPRGTNGGVGNALNTITPTITIVAATISHVLRDEEKEEELSCPSASLATFIAFSFTKSCVTDFVEISESRGG